MNIKGIFKTVKLFCHNNAPNILTGTSCLGLGVTVYNAIQDTRKAMTICRREKPESFKEELQLTWKCYIPTAISATSTAACIIGSRTASDKQLKSMSSAYLGSQALLQEYQRKVVERIGVNKERETYEEAVKAVADRQAPPILYSDGGMVGEVIDTGKGNTLFYDEVADKWFKSDINYLKTMALSMNEEILNGEMYYDWNEIMYRWGLPRLKYGSDRLITTEHLFKPKFTSELMENGVVRIIISYDLVSAQEYFDKER